jgi:hypothetical protein
MFLGSCFGRGIGFLLSSFCGGGAGSVTDNVRWGVLSKETPIVANQANDPAIGYNRTPTQKPGQFPISGG